MNYYLPTLHRPPRRKSFARPLPIERNRPDLSSVIYEQRAAGRGWDWRRREKEKEGTKAKKEKKRKKERKKKIDGHNNRVAAAPFKFRPSTLAAEFPARYRADFNGITGGSLSTLPPSAPPSPVALLPPPSTPVRFAGSLKDGRRTDLESRRADWQISGKRNTCVCRLLRICDITRNLVPFFS